MISDNEMQGQGIFYKTRGRSPGIAMPSESDTSITIVSREASLLVSASSEKDNSNVRRGGDGGAP